jgi:hypothetical protein
MATDAFGITHLAFLALSLLAGQDFLLYFISCQKAYQITRAVARAPCRFWPGGMTAITADGPDQVEFTFGNGETASTPLVIGVLLADDMVF